MADTQRQYGLRFITPQDCTGFLPGSCPEDPENVCSQIDENKPLPVPNSYIEKEACEDLLGEFALNLMGYVPPENVFYTAGRMIKPIEPSSLEMGGFLNSDSDPLIPVMKIEATKKMCSLKDYSFTIGD